VFFLVFISGKCNYYKDEWDAVSVQNEFVVFTKIFAMFLLC